MTYPRLRLSAAILAGAFAFSSALGGLNDYRYSATFTVAGAAEGVSLSKFPVLVRISAARISGA